MEKNHADINRIPIYTSALKLALHSALQPLGQDVKESILVKLDQSGIHLNIGGYYTLHDLEEALVRLLGDGASPILKRLAAILNDLGEI